MTTAPDSLPGFSSGTGAPTTSYASPRVSSPKPNRILSDSRSVSKTSKPRRRSPTTSQPRPATSRKPRSRQRAHTPRPSWDSSLGRRQRVRRPARPSVSLRKPRKDLHLDRRPLLEVPGEWLADLNRTLLTQSHHGLKTRAH